MKKIVPRLVVAIPLGIPPAALFALYATTLILAGLDLDNHTVPFAPQLRAVVFLAAWTALIYWAAWETDSMRRAVSRTCWALSMALFLLPIGMILLLITTSPDTPDNIFPMELAVVVFSFLGVVLGTVMLPIAVVVSPQGAAERSPERLFQETGETLRRIGVSRIALALMLLIAGVVGLRLGSTGGYWSEKYTSIETNGSQTCGVRTDGTAHCWGSSHSTPPEDERFVSIAPGSGFACGLREDGSLTCWGSMGVSSKGPFSEISTGYEHACALRPDGTVECWGQWIKDRYGEGATAPPDGELFTNISAGRDNTCGIRQDATGICWGSLDSPPSGVQFKAISNGGDHACGIRVEEDVICWGSGASPAGLMTVEGPFVSLSSGVKHVCGLRPDGSVHCWGASTAHEVHNFGSDPVRGEHFVAISSDRDYNCGLRQNGTVKCWGGNWRDRLYR